MTSLATLDYVAIFLYLLLMAGIGLFFKWYVKDINAYTKGSGTIPWVVAGVSNFMAMFSTFVFVAYAGIAFQYGLISVVIFTSTVPACIVAALFFAKRWRRAGVSTPIEYLETRFNPAVRQTIGWVGIIMRILDNTVRLYAIGIFLTAVTPLSLPVSLIVSSVIVIVFTLFGGIWAVTIMGTVQFVILIFASIILCFLSLHLVGGIGSLAEKLPDHFKFFNGPDGRFFWLSIYSIMIVIKYNENWSFIQRFYIVKDEKAAKKVGYLTAALFFIFPIVFLLPPIVTRVVIPHLADKEMAYVAISSKLLPAGLMGVMIASMFAATMSSLNSDYNVMASVLSKDVYQRLVNKRATDRQLLLVARLSTVVIGIIVLFGGLFIKDFGGAFEANKLFTGIFAIPIDIAMVLGIVNKRATSKGAMLTVILGSVSGLVLNAMPGVFSWEMATLIELLLCLVIFYGSTLPGISPKSIKENVLALFERLSTPIKDLPSIDTGFKNALFVLYVASLVVSGILFLSMGFPSIRLLSGVLTVLSGVICFLIAGFLFLIRKRI